MSDLRSHILRVAAELPKGDETRRALLAAVVGDQKQGAKRSSPAWTAGAQAKKTKEFGSNVDTAAAAWVKKQHVEPGDPKGTALLIDFIKGWKGLRKADSNELSPQTVSLIEDETRKNLRRHPDTPLVAAQDWVVFNYKQYYRRQALGIVRDTYEKITHTKPPQTRHEQQWGLRKASTVPNEYLTDSLKSGLVYTLSTALQRSGVTVDNDADGLIALPSGMVVNVAPGIRGIEVSAEIMHPETGDTVKVFEKVYPWAVSPKQIAVNMAPHLR